MLRFFLINTLLLALFTASGCHCFRQPQTTGPFSTDQSLLTRNEAIKVLNSRNIPINTLKAEIEIKAKIRFVKGQFHLMANMLHQRPGNNRIRVYIPGNSTRILDYLQIADNISMLFPQEKIVLVGKKEHLKNLDLPSAKFNYDAAMEALLSPASLAQLSQTEDENVKWIEKRNHYWVEFEQGNYLYKVKLRKKDLLITCLELKSHKGKKIASIKYLNYKLFEKQLFPEQLELTLYKPIKTKAKIVVKKLLVNPKLQREVFQMHAPLSYQLINIEQ